MIQCINLCPFSPRLAPRSARFQPGLAFSVLLVVSGPAAVDSTHHRSGHRNSVLFAFGIGFVAGDREGEVGKVRLLWNDYLFFFFLVNLFVVALYRHLYIVYSVFHC